jgi:predicted O-methyltransferase YrrM
MNALATHIRALQTIVEQSGELLEGNCLYYHNSLQLAPELQAKQRNLLRAANDAQTIMEIGFNAGHSLLLFLMKAPAARYVIFDICEHSYTRPCFAYLRQSFPAAQLTLLEGDSLQTVPAWIAANPGEHFDLVHVDGGHAAEIAKADLEGAIQVARTGGLIILDDTNDPAIRGQGDLNVQRGFLEPAPQEQTALYEHLLYYRSVAKFPSNN